MTELDVTAVHYWRRAKATKEACDAALELAKDELQRAEQAALDAFERAGIQSIKLDGRTTYLRRDLYASTRKGAKEALIAALRHHELADLVGETVSGQSLSAYVREREREGDEVPPEIAEHITVAEVFRVGERAS